MSAPQALRRALSYGKFNHAGPFRLLVPLTGYHLQRECVQALRALGHEVRALPLQGLNCAQVVRAVLTALLTFKPDCLLVINHLGFDDGHQLGAVLDGCNIPVACWYCDSPFFVLKNGGLPAPQMTSVFVWEKTFMPTLEAYGAQDVHHLPLGCDPNQFEQDGSHDVGADLSVSFVGDSMRSACAQWQERLSPAEAHYSALWADKLSRGQRLQLSGEVAALQQQRPQLALWDALGAATFEATRTYRMKLLRALPSACLTVFGDAGWQGALPAAAAIEPTVAYGPDLASVYRRSEVSLNATSLQMPTAVNQRVFDVPLAGGFVLSDAQQDLQNLFAVGSEAITYNSADELADLAQFYRHRPQLRRTITRQAQRRIRACHTYRHRLQTLLEAMRQRHA